MKRGLIVIVAIVAVIAIIGGSLISTYNNLVDKQANVENKEAEIQVYLQRRADLIPNLVNTVKAYAEHEEGVYTALAEARAKLNSASNTEEFNEANESFEWALSRLLVVVENYPELQADKNFIALQDQLEGTENRIATARKDYNDAATDYNATIKKFPNVIFAGILGFEEAVLYEALDTSQFAPIVNFD
ncbi:MAG: LemA family protein [Clostridia bacterium]|nr:LemA family protein [Clostridia bacterium]